MKIKVDKDEYEQLLARVEHLEQDDANSWKRFRDLEYRLRQYVDSYFERKCQMVMIKRDKDQIIAELRKQAIDNIFKDYEKDKS